MLRVLLLIGICAATTLPARGEIADLNRCDADGAERLGEASGPALGSEYADRRTLELGIPVAQGRRLHAHLPTGVAGHHPDAQGAWIHLPEPGRERQTVRRTRGATRPEGGERGQRKRGQREPEERWAVLQPAHESSMSSFGAGALDWAANDPAPGARCYRCQRPFPPPAGPDLWVPASCNALWSMLWGFLARACRLAANRRVERPVGVECIWALPAMTARAEDGTVPHARSQPRTEEDCHASSRPPPPRPRPDRRRRGDEAGTARGGTTRRARRARRDRNTETSASGSRPSEARPRVRVASITNPEARTSAGRCGAVPVSLRT